MFLANVRYDKGNGGRKWRNGKHFNFQNVEVPYQAESSRNNKLLTFLTENEANRGTVQTNEAFVGGSILYE